MNAALTPPFPVAGAGVLVVEAALSIALVMAFWATYPAGYAQVGLILAACLLACWFIAWSLGSRASATPSRVQAARASLVVGAAFGLTGLFLGLLGGPHLGSVAIYGVGAQLVTLIAGRIYCAT